MKPSLDELRRQVRAIERGEKAVVPSVPSLADLRPGAVACCREAQWESCSCGARTTCVVHGESCKGRWGHD